MLCRLSCSIDLNCREHNKQANASTSENSNSFSAGGVADADAGTSTAADNGAGVVSLGATWCRKEGGKRMLVQSL